MNNAKVKDIMEKNPELIAPDATLEEACRKMKDVDCGALPVGSEEKLEGIITDRDIIVRAIAMGVDPAIAMVADYMTPDVYDCREDDSLADAADLMNRHNVSRLIVRKEAGALCGILTFGHALRSKKAGDEDVTEMMYCAVGRKAA